MVRIAEDLFISEFKDRGYKLSPAGKLLDHRGIEAIISIEDYQKAFDAWAEQVEYNATIDARHKKLSSERDSDHHKIRSLVPEWKKIIETATDMIEDLISVEMSNNKSAMARSKAGIKALITRLRGIHKEYSEIHKIM